MESTARLRWCGLSARKMRQVADLVRGKDVEVALHSLRFVTKVAARPMEKLITSAVANAREKADAAEQRFDADAFYVKTVMVGQGPVMKRFRPRAQGRAYRIRKPTCHVDLVLAEHGSRAAARRENLADAPRSTAASTTAESGKGAKKNAGAKLTAASGSRAAARREK
jgi:large subunit ribosomal protein L22